MLGCQETIKIAVSPFSPLTSASTDLIFYILNVVLFSTCVGLQCMWRSHADSFIYPTQAFPAPDSLQLQGVRCCWHYFLCGKLPVWPAEASSSSSWVFLTDLPAFEVFLCLFYSLYKVSHWSQNWPGTVTHQSSCLSLLSTWSPGESWEDRCASLLSWSTLPGQICPSGSHRVLPETFSKLSGQKPRTWTSTLYTGLSPTTVAVPKVLTVPKFRMYTWSVYTRTCIHICTYLYIVISLY